MTDFAVMKSNKGQLVKRGLLSQDFNVASCVLSFLETLHLNQGNIPTDKRIATRPLKNEDATIEIEGYLEKKQTIEKNFTHRLNSQIKLERTIFQKKRLQIEITVIFLKKNAIRMYNL